MFNELAIIATATILLSIVLIAVSYAVYILSERVKDISTIVVSESRTLDSYYTVLTNLRDQMRIVTDILKLHGDTIVKLPCDIYILNAKIEGLGDDVINLIDEVDELMERLNDISDGVGKVALDIAEKNREENTVSLKVSQVPAGPSTKTVELVDDDGCASLVPLPIDHLLLDKLCYENGASWYVYEDSSRGEFVLVLYIDDRSAEIPYNDFNADLLTVIKEELEKLKGDTDEV